MTGTTQTPGLYLDAAVQLSAAIGANTAALRDAEQRKREMAASVAWVPAPAFSFGALPFAVPADQFGPKNGYAWAVQRVTVAGFGATTDLVTLYKGRSLADVQPQNALFTFTIAAAGAVATWHPGGKGLILKANERFCAAGTFTGTLGVVSCDVIQVTEAQLPYYLL